MFSKGVSEGVLSVWMERGVGEVGGGGTREEGGGGEKEEQLLTKAKTLTHTHTHTHTHTPQPLLSGSIKPGQTI
jgi:hypothetical protein